MPKRIDSSVWVAIKNAFLRRDPKPSYKTLADDYGVSKASIERKASAENWQADREVTEQVKESQRVKSARKASTAVGRKVDDLDALDGFIADLYFDGKTADIKSREGAANAMANLLKVRRELFPPNADELAEIAFKLNINPNDFVEALKRRWEESMPVVTSEPQKSQS